MLAVILAFLGVIWVLVTWTDRRNRRMEREFALTERDVAELARLKILERRLLKLAMQNVISDPFAVIVMDEIQKSNGSNELND